MLSVPTIKKLFVEDASDELDGEAHALFYRLFVENKNDKMIDTALDELRLSTEAIAKHLSHPNGLIVVDLVELGNLERLKKVHAILGDNLMKNIVLVGDKNAIESAIGEKIEIIKYFMSIDGVKNEYISNKELIYRCIYWMSTIDDNESVVSYLRKELNLNEEKLKELQEYKFDSESYYFEKSISDEAIIRLLK